MFIKQVRFSPVRGIKKDNWSKGFVKTLTIVILFAVRIKIRQNTNKHILLHFL